MNSYGMNFVMFCLEECRIGKSGALTPGIASIAERSEMTSLLDDYCIIPLTQGQFAKVDAEDFERISQYKWCAHWVPSSGQFRAMRRTWNGKEASYIVYMHREVMGLKRGDKKLVDHINGDQLDNRKINLRFATKATNGMNRPAPKSNTSGYKGVSWCSERGLWTAQITANKKTKNLGRYASIEDARIAYQNAAELLHKEFARFE
jgi:hypothetical protein